MAQRNSTEEIRQVRLSEWEESQRSLDSSFFSNHGANIFETNSSASSSTIGFRSLSSLFDRDDYEHYRTRYSVDHHHVHEIIDEDAKFQDGKGGLFMEKLITNVEKDNLELLQKIKNRIDKVGVELAKVEVRYKNLCVEAECEVVHGKPLPTLWNSLTSSLFDVVKLCGWNSHKAKIKVIDDVSGVIRPGRITLLLGHPGCGKTTLLKALSGQLNPSLKVTGEISYNGYKLEEFVPQKTSAYVSQYDLHISEMTVRETLDFSARFQGVGSGEEVMKEVSRREKEAGIIPDPDIDSYMKAVSTKGKQRTLQTDYTLKILGLDVCSDTIVGDAEERGISGGQKKRLTTGEMIVGPRKVLFMDEITNGIDSSTAIQMVACLQQFAHTSDATILVSLLQPPPEAFDLFDDILLMAEGKVVYHGPRNQVLDYFEYCGFKCPSRKAVADFLQEVTSKKDQAQYWYSNEQSYSFASVDSFVEKFKASPLGKEHDKHLSELCAKSQKERSALSFSPYSLSKWVLFRNCLSKEILLIKRNYFIYLFQTIQLVIIAFMTMTVFLRTRMDIDAVEANYFMGALFYGLISLLLDGIPELSMTVARLPVYYKQKELSFYPAWAYAIPAAILKIPLSLVQSLVWTSLTYFVIGYSPQLWRFICQFILLFTVHLTSLSMFRFVASVFRTMEASMVAGSFVILLVLLFGGFIIEQPSMPVWLKWGFWLSPLTYGEIGLSLNEFLAPRWQKITSTNTTIGHATLQSRGLHFDGHFFWMSLGVLLGFTIVFNIGFNLALSFLKPPELSRAIISHEKLHHSHIQGNEDVYYDPVAVETSKDSHSSTNRESSEGGMILPFHPLTVTFKKVQYYVDMPLEMRKRGFDQKKLQLLSDISGAFRPGVLTALMGVSGAGKTTLLDVLAGRKTSGYIEGSIKIGGYSKVQETFARISGYCEQMDVHSPQLTIEESLIFSACLRLSPQIDSNVKAEFVNEVLETIELDGIKDTLVGIPSVSGLSAEQRKRLTIAVELVANPSIIFMDEPTSGLDARAAAIVMRTVKKIADAGRTIVCTIHQPSIDIFEAFDELILLKHGGRIIYSGPLGQNSRNVIEYFEGIPGVPKIKDKTNPATWMLEVTSTSAETKLGVDFAQIYRDSALYKNNKGLITNLSSPSPGSKDLHFPTNFSRNGWGQFKSCLWKQHLTYWRSPSYNLMRIVHALISSVLFGLLFWKQGQKLDNQQDLFNILGSMNTAVIFLGINNCSSALQYVARERTVMYRERFAGMYSSWAYALAQVMIEIPYILIQTITFVIITYPMIGYYVSAFQIFWYFYGMFCSLLYYNYLGMLLVSLTPNFIVAGILTMPFYSIFNLFSGFLIPRKQIPKWWVWLYNLTPTSWALEGLILSQYGDIHTKITVFGETKTVSGFLHDYFGYQYGQLSFVAAVTVVFPLAYASLFAFFIGRLNFQRR